MKKKKKNRSKSAYTTGLLFVVAVLLLLGSAAGSSRAALTYYSENYSAELQTFDIGVTLVENTLPVSRRDYTQKDDKWYEEGGALLAHMLEKEGEETEIQLGRKYEELLQVENSGNIDEYVRVMIYRYWVKDERRADGTPVPLEDREKLTELSPEWINLYPWVEEEQEPMPADHNDWVLDKNASTRERTVLYYTKILKTGERSKAFADTLAINKALATKVTTEKSADGNTITTMTYDYDGVEFVLQVDVDAVQTHNGADAIKSAWGVDVIVDASGNLSLRR